MTYTLHELVQGSPQWHEHRRSFFNASEASAMAGISKYKTRDALIRERATGIEKEVTATEQRLFDGGHANEAIARPWAEEIIGEELFPVTVSATIDGLPLSASLDGLTMDDETAWEHKSLNKDLAASLAAGIIPAEYKPQMEQQMLITGAKKCLFMASSGVKETMCYAWYVSDPAVRASLLAGWNQFKEDVAAYQHVEVIPAAVAAPKMALPALSIQVGGSINLISNLDLFGQKLQAFIDGIDKAPTDDQGFADAEAAVKTLQEAQDALEAAEAGALAQTASIDDMRRAVAFHCELARTTRLALDKMVKQRKESIRVEIMQEGKDAIAAHIATLNRRLAKVQIPPVAADFAGKIKGKKMLSSVRSAVADEVARVKIESNRLADIMQINLTTLADYVEFDFLFRDFAVLVLKDNDDLIPMIKMRIADHQAAEEKRLAGEREKMRLEEEAKAHAKVEAERQRKESVERAEAKALAQKAQADAHAAANENMGAAVGGSQPVDVRTEPASGIGTIQSSGQSPAVRVAPMPSQKNTKAVTVRRPSDHEIIQALVLDFGVTEGVVIDWLAEMDLSELAAA